MKTQAWPVLGGAVLLALGIGLTTELSRAEDKKDVRATILKIADLLAKKDTAAAKKEAAAVPQDTSLEDIMEVLKLRKSKGFGIGAKPNPAVPDGIEAVFLNMDRRVPKTLLTDAGPDLEKAAYVLAAIAEIVVERCPVKTKTGEKDPVKWKKWTEDMRKSALEMAEAIKAKKTPEIKAAAKKLNASCADCHLPFRKD